MSVSRVSALKPTASMIIIHGLGDSSDGWKFFADLLHRQEQFRHINVILPNAPVIPVTVCNGMPTSSWFDLTRFPIDRKVEEDPVSFWKSVDEIKQLVETEVKNGIPSNRIVVGGFSQGAALSLAVGATCNRTLAGIVALSGFCPVEKSLKDKVQTTNLNTPVFFGHGDRDPVVPIAAARHAVDVYKKAGLQNIEFKEYRGMEHSSSPEEMADLMRFLGQTIPQ
ncbi:hypothetical protein KL938_000086 [Ogataea parapolymorpha]|nr:hypothetical protein KL938_000086 [Ogataea parapolymorpha]